VPELEADPLSKVYTALWELLLSRESIRKRFKLGNRVRLDNPDDRSPEKVTVLSADLPEIRITPVAIIPHLHRTSSSSSLTKRFAVQVSTGERQVTHELLPSQWEVYCAMGKWLQVLTSLTWRGNKFVKMTRLADVADSLFRGEDHGHITGWATVWMCDVEMWFSTPDILAEV